MTVASLGAYYARGLLSCMSRGTNARHPRVHSLVRYSRGAGSLEVVHLHGSLSSPKCFACHRPTLVTSPPIR
jgi:hypothetical protein